MAELHDHASVSKMALSATIHCLIGCSIGEVIGLLIGNSLHLEPLQTTLLAFVLSFISGYSVSTLPLLRQGIHFPQALRLVFAADTLSILTMTIVGNIVMLMIPGAMHKHLTHPDYWLAMAIALTMAFIVAYPVNRALLKRGKGHAVIHDMHQ